MAVDPKLRDVLDTLDESAASSRPAEDRELLISVLRRLELRDRVRHRARAMPQADLEAERDEARRRQEELEALAREQSMSDEKLRALQDERDALLARQEELEDRLAQLEAASHGGSLSYIEEPSAEPDPIVEFSRVNLDDLGAGEEELMEFQEDGSAFDTPDPDAWADADDGGWNQADQSAERPVTWDGNDGPRVEWDEQSDWAEPQADADTWENDDDAEWQEPAGEWEHRTVEETTWESTTTRRSGGHSDRDETSWADLGDEDAWSEEPKASAAPAEGPAEDLDDKTRRDLAALEAQLAELEAELARRPKKRDDY